MKNLRGNEKILRNVAGILNIDPEQVPIILKKLQKEIDETENEIRKLEKP